MPPALDLQQMFRHHLTTALQAIQSGHLGFAEKNCLRALELVPNSPEALNLLGLLASRAGANKRATGLFRAAVKMRPKDIALRGNLERSRAQPGSASDSQSHRSPLRYLLIKSWGYGFWSDVSHVLGCLLLAELTNRIPVVHWGNNSLYGGTQETDGFTLFFKPVSGVTLNEIRSHSLTSLFPTKWTASNLAHDDIQKWAGQGSRVTALHLLERAETVIVSDFYIGIIDVVPWLTPQHVMHKKSIDEIHRYVIRRYLSPLQQHLEACANFVAEHLRDGPYIAIHLRGSDKFAEDTELDLANKECLSVLARQKKEKRIFLLTDDKRLEEECRRIYGPRVVCTSSQRTSGEIGIHYIKDGEPIKKGEEILLDSLIAAGAETFIGNGRSNVAAMISLLRPWKPNHLHLVRPSQLFERNLFLHMPK